MNKIALASLFTIAAFSQVAFAGSYDNNLYEDDYPPEPKPVEISEYQLTHSSFFMEADLGLGAQSIDGYIHKDGKIVGTAFDGDGLAGAFNFGINIKRWIAPYLGFSFVFGSGHVSFDSADDKLKNFSFYTLGANIGTLIFPFRNVDGMSGLFLGFELGVGGVEVSSDKLDRFDYLVNNSRFLVTIELGHVWDLTPRWSAGIKGFVSFNSFNDDYDYYDSDYYPSYAYDYEMYDLSGVSIGLMATLIRR